MANPVSNGHCYSQFSGRKEVRESEDHPQVAVGHWSLAEPFREGVGAARCLSSILHAKSSAVKRALFVFATTELVKEEPDVGSVPLESRLSLSGR